MNGKVRVRNTALLFTPILAAVYLFAPFYLLQFVSLFTLVLIIVSRVYSELLLRGLKIIRRDNELRCFRYEWITVELFVENRAPVPAPAIACDDSPGMLSVYRDNRMLRALPRRSRISFSWQLYGSTRGIFSLGPARVRGRDPLGLFPFEIIPAETARLVVYPAPASVSLAPPEGLPLGALLTENRLYEDLTRRRSLREYQTGDEPRRINWKASARLSGRSSSLLVNEYEASFNSPVVIFLNLDPYEYDLRKRELFFERSIETAAALCLMAGRQRQELGLVLYQPRGENTVTTLRSGPGTLIPILERLAALARPAADTVEAEASSARVRASVRVMLEQGKRLSGGTRMYYVGPERGAEEYLILDSLKRNRVTPSYFILNEARLEHVPRRYQVREAGYDIL